MNQKSIFGVVAIFAGSNILGSVLRLITGLLTAQILAPEILGRFNGIYLVLGYTAFLQLGALNGLNRELPYYVGAGRIAEAFDLAAVAQMWALIIGGLVFFAMSLISAHFYFLGQFELALGWLSCGLSAFTSFYVEQYLQVTFRTAGHFNRLAIATVCQNVVGLFSVVLICFYNFYGLCLKSILTSFVAFTMIFFWRPVRVTPRWDARQFKRLLKIGLPIFWVGQIYAWWYVLNSTLILGYLGSYGLGLYQLSAITIATIGLLPQALCQVTYPRMAERYAQTNSIGSLISIVWSPILSFSFLMMLIAIAGWILAPRTVMMLLPSYSDGVPAARWAIVLESLGVFTPLNNIFNVTKNQRQYLVALISAIAVYLISLFLLSTNGINLESFLQSMVAGKIALILVAYAFVSYLVFTERSQPKSKDCLR